jgi:DNA-directed RNA polymerase II subunit RPB2
LVFWRILGGYFIINGSEKTVLGQERAAENQIYCYNVSKTSKWTWQAEMKCVPRNKCISPKQINIMIYNKNNIGPCLYLQIPRLYARFISSLLADVLSSNIL